MMSVRLVILLLVLIAIAVFTAANWGTFIEPTTLSLVFTTVEAPLGLIMLGITIMVTLLFFGYAIYLQTSVLVEARQHARELKAQRNLADQAEVSRFTALQGLMEAEFRKTEERFTRTHTTLLQRLDQIEGNLRTSVEQAGSTLAAYLGEIDDRLDSRGPGA